MASINTQISLATGLGGDDGAGSDLFNGSGGFTTYRPRGVIDLNQNRLPTTNDINVAVTLPLIPLDAFVCANAGTPVSGTLGVATVNAGDYLVYLSNDPTVASNWIAIRNVDPTKYLPNCPPRFIRVIGGRPDGLS